MHIAFVTSASYSDLTPDDRLAVAALTGRGATVSAAIWTDPSTDWSGFDLIVVRSPWDYYQHAVEFRAWIDMLDSLQLPVLNAPAVLRWNMEKTYLRDLERAGVPIVPTVWLEPGARQDIGAQLDALLAERGWDEAIVKPVISAGAHRTWRVSRTGGDDVHDRISESLLLSEMMVQPFMPEIQAHGEWSLMFFAGEFSHAVRKLPADGDFRVQASHGGSSASDHPTDDVVVAARRVLDAAPAPWLYARVDGIETGAGFLLLELEMLEPSLFLSHSPAGTIRFADEILRAAEELSSNGRSKKATAPASQLP